MLLPEVEARRVLRGSPHPLQVLAPFGAWIGCGTLRVLRVKIDDDEPVDVTAGYESYVQP